jgi:hypothetical protein
MSQTKFITMVDTTCQAKPARMEEKYKPVAHVLIACAELLGLQLSDSIKANTQSNSAIVRIINVTGRYPPALPLYRYIVLGLDIPRPL